jgi:hypothetical protein
MIKQLLALCFCWLVANKSTAQKNNVNGFIQNIKLQPLENVNIVLTPKNSTQIKAFAITDNKGFFELQWPEKIDTVIITVSIVGYEKRLLSVTNKTQLLTIVLKEQATQLPTVVIKQEPIVQNGDTTAYLVKDFAEKQDRVIGDVIKKLPGVEIDEITGEIKFNGKAISHYYIDGLDLLESKYNIANRNIPANIVDEVQLLARTKDIKLLDSFNIYPEPSLNIKLKKNSKNKFIGKANLGLGVTPLLWDNELTGLQFSKGFQFISALKNNNTGGPLNTELSDNISVTKKGDVQSDNIKEEIINKLTAQTPNIKPSRYLFNNTTLFHFSSLFMLRNKAQLKMHLSYLNNYVTNGVKSSSAFTFGNGQAMNITESINEKSNSNQILGEAIYSINDKRLYLKNSFRAKLNYTKQNSITQNPLAVLQVLQTPFFDYANNLLIHLPIKRKIVSFKSEIMYNKTPQEYTVVPGQFPELINQTLPYQQISQNARLLSLKANNSVTLFYKIRGVNSQIKLGSKSVHQNIQTNIGKLYNQTYYLLNDTFKNNIKWDNLAFYCQSDMTIARGKKYLDVSLPVELNILAINNVIKLHKQRVNNTFFNPRLNFSFPISQFLSGDFSCYLQNTIGNISQITQGYILRNYRSLSNSDSLVPLQREQNINFGLDYKNSAVGIFSNISVSFNNTKRNIIYSQEFNNFFLKSTAVLLNNYQKNFIVSGTTSKYFSVSKINISINYNYALVTTDILQQQQLVRSKSAILTSGLRTNFNLFPRFSIESHTTFDFFKNKLIQPIYKLENTASKRVVQIARFYFMSSKNSYLNFTKEFYSIWYDKTNKANIFFGDIGFTKKFKKTEISLYYTNITNTKKYLTVNNYDNLQQVTSYNMRPTNILINFRFNF